jgi:hypothetical protein
MFAKVVAPTPVRARFPHSQEMSGGGGGGDPLSRREARGVDALLDASDSDDERLDLGFGHVCLEDILREDASSSDSEGEARNCCCCRRHLIVAASWCPAL